MDSVTIVETNYGASVIEAVKLAKKGYSVSEFILPHDNFTTYEIVMVPDVVETTPKRRGKSTDAS